MAGLAGVQPPSQPPSVPMPVSLPTPAELPSQPTRLELDILGHLLAAGGTCPSLTALPTAIKGSLRKRTEACQHLRDRNWLTYDHDIAQFGLTLTGKTLLGLDTSVWPITPDQRLILRAGQGGRIGPSQIPLRVPVSDRQRLLEQLVAQGLIVVYERAIAHLHLTARGQDYLTQP